MSNAHPPTDSPLSSGSPSPVLSPIDASSPLILLSDTEDSTDRFFDFSSDSEDDQVFDPPFDSRRPIIPPLQPSVVFLYLLAPYLKFGAMYLPNESDLSIRHIVPALVVFAILSAFSRHILYLLARYLRKTDLDDIVSSTFVRGRANESRYEHLRNLCRFSTGSLRVLLGAIYLQESSHVLLTLLPEKLFLPSRVILHVALASFIVPLSVVHSLSAKPIIYATWASIATYVIWLACACYAHTQGTLFVNQAWLPMGSLWQGTTTIAFAFTSPSPLYLYASLKSTMRAITTTKTPKSRSFKTLSIFSGAVALALILPLAFLSYHPESEQHAVSLQSFMELLNAITLLLAIPSILITTPSISLPGRLKTSTKYCLSKILQYLAIFLLSLASTPISGILSNALLICTLSATYILPALLHITNHHFSRPLTIVVPHSPNHDPERPESPSHEALLQRKERALQKRQKMRRIIWDIGVWVLLVPVGGGGIVWAAGRLAGRW